MLPVKIAPRFLVFTHSSNLTCFEKSARHLHGSPISVSWKKSSPRVRGAPLHDQIFLFTPLHAKITRYIKFLRIENLNIVLRRLQVNIEQSFPITLFCRNTFLHIIEASHTKMGICDLPTLQAQIQKRLPFFEKQENGIWEVTKRGAQIQRLSRFWTKWLTFEKWLTRVYLTTRELSTVPKFWKMECF